MNHPTPTAKESVFQDDDFLVSKTDTKGLITYVNPSFIATAGYTEQELLGQPHHIVRHPDMPRVIFKLLWEEITNEREIFAYVKNIGKDGGFYWVYANVTASLDSKGNIIGYYSVRRKPNPKALDIIKPLYEKLVSLESGGDMIASQEYLTKVLKEKGVSYDEISNNLQRL